MVYLSQPSRLSPKYTVKVIHCGPEAEGGQPDLPCDRYRQRVQAEGVSQSVMACAQLMRGQPCGRLTIRKPETEKIRFFFGHKVPSCCGKLRRLKFLNFFFPEALRKVENGPRNLTDSGGGSGILKTMKNCVIL